MLSIALVIFYEPGTKAKKEFDSYLNSKKESSKIEGTMSANK